MIACLQRRQRGWGITFIVLLLVATYGGLVIYELLPVFFNVHVFLLFPEPLQLTLIDVQYLLSGVLALVALFQSVVRPPPIVSAPAGASVGAPAA